MVFLHADAGHEVDLLAEEISGVAFGHGPVNVAKGLRSFVTSEIYPGDRGRVHAAAEARLDGPGTEKGGRYEAADAKDEEYRAEVAADRGQSGEVKGEPASWREAGAENGGRDGHDEAGLGIGQLYVFKEISLLVPEEFRAVDDLAGGNFVDGFL